MLLCTSGALISDFQIPHLKDSFLNSSTVFDVVSPSSFGILFLLSSSENNFSCLSSYPCNFSCFDFCVGALASSFTAGILQTSTPDLDMHHPLLQGFHSPPSPRHFTCVDNRPSPSLPIVQPSSCLFPTFNLLFPDTTLLSHRCPLSCYIGTQWFLFLRNTFLLNLHLGLGYCFPFSEQSQRFGLSPDFSFSASYSAALASFHYISHGGPI